MPGHGRTKWRFWRNALALTCGVITGAAISAAESMWNLLRMWRDDQPIETGTYEFWAILYIGFYTTAAIIVALVASAIWWASGPNFRRHLMNAVGLGFCLGGLAAVSWLVKSNAAHGIDRDLVLALVVCGFAGAVSGAVTWWISHPHRKDLFVAME